MRVLLVALVWLSLFCHCCLVKSTVKLSSTVADPKSTFHCQSDEDCELLGTCDVTTGACTCSPGFAGISCGRINLKPADRVTKGRVWPQLAAQHDAQSSIDCYLNQSCSSWGFTSAAVAAISNADANANATVNINGKANGRTSTYSAIVNVGCGPTATHVTGTQLAILSTNSPDAQSGFSFQRVRAPATSFNPHLIHIPLTGIDLDNVSKPHGQTRYVLYFRVNDINDGQHCTGSLDAGEMSKLKQVCWWLVASGGCGGVHERQVVVEVTRLMVPGSRAPGRSLGFDFALGGLCC